MKTNDMKKLRLTLFPALLSLALVLPGCGQSDSRNSSEEPRSEAPVQVKTEELQPVPFAEVLSLTGYIKSLDDVVVSTEEGGVLRTWAVRRGAYVRKGELLASMKDDVLRPQYEAARAQYEIAELTYQKQRKVFEEQGISEVQVLTAQYNRDAALAQMELAKNRLERTSIRSPIDGILDDRFIDEGELAPPGAPVARVVNLDRTKVVVNVPESQIGLLSKGDEAGIGVSAFPGEEFKGIISFVGSAVVADNRTVVMEILVRNPERKLRPDMIARVRIEATAGRNAIVVPEGVVSQIDQKTSVVYIEADGKVERKSVTLGGRNNGNVEIVSGLQPGDHLIVDGFRDVFDGQEVEVAPDSASGDPR